MSDIADQVEIYRPSNGTEGHSFIAQWCEQCSRHEVDGMHCAILGRTMCYQAADPNYPREWRYDGDRPICTAFVALGDPLPPLRDDKTVDMFGDKP